VSKHGKIPVNGNKGIHQNLRNNLPRSYKTSGGDSLNRAADHFAKELCKRGIYMGIFHLKTRSGKNVACFHFRGTKNLLVDVTPCQVIPKDRDGNRIGDGWRSKVEMDNAIKQFSVV